MVLLSFIFMGYSAKGIFFPNKECMQWNENHYEEVDCSNNQISIGQLNTTLPLDENVMSLKKIDPNQKISFFKNAIKIFIPIFLKILYIELIMYYIGIA